jgi:hypothetical protein
MSSKAGLTILTAALIAAGSSARAADPPRPQLLERGHDVGAYTLAGNGAGERIVVVRRDLPTSGMDVFTAPPGAPLGPATRLRGGDAPTPELKAAVGSDGTVAIVGSRDRVVALVRTPGAAFGKPEAISGHNVFETSVAFDRQGAATAIWVRDATKGSAAYVEASTLPPGGHWSKPTLISYERRGAASPQVAFDAAGDSVAVWTRDGSPIDVAFRAAKRRKRFENEVVAATRPAGGAFSRPQVVSDPRFNSDEASLSVNSTGQAAIAWVLNTPGDKHLRIGGAFREPGKRFGRPRFLTAAGRDSYGTSIALDEAGRALLVWTIPGDRPDMESSANQVLAAVRRPGGPLGKPVRLSDRHTGFPEVAMSPDGHAVVAWVRESRFGYLAQARRVTTAGALGPITQISPRSEYVDTLDAVVDDSGSALFTWTRNAHHSARLEAATLPRR